MHVITMANNKGGVTKTSSSLALATLLFKAKKKVLIVDFDQQSNLSTYSNLDTTYPSIYDVLRAQCRIQDAIQHKEHYDVIASAKTLSLADRQFVDNDDVFLLQDALNFVKKDYDIVIIDNGPSKSILQTMSLVASDSMIVPIEVDRGAYDGLVSICEDLEKLKSSRLKLSHAKLIGVIYGKYENTNMHKAAFARAEKFLSSIKGEKPFFEIVRKSIAASECKEFGESISEYAPCSTASLDYEIIIKDLLERINDK